MYQNWTNEQVKYLINSRTFKTNVHQLTNATGMTEHESVSELSNELLSHRMAKFTPVAVIRGLINDDAFYTFKITYTRKDIERNYFRNIKKQIDTTSKLKESAERQYLFDVDHKLKPDDLNRLIGLLPQLFKSKITQQFVATCLKYGKDETLIRLGLTSKQFNQKIRNAERYCDRHRDRFKVMAVNRDQLDLMDEELCLIELTNCLESCDYTDTKFQALLTFLDERTDDLVGNIAGIHNQSQIINHWTDASNADKYALIDGIYDRLQDVQHKLKEMR